MGTYSLKFDTSLIEHYKDVFKKEEGEFSYPQYTFFSFKNKNWQVTFYRSAKLLIQGKNPEYIMEKYFNLKNDNSCFSDNNGDLAPYPHIGSDESGKGDFFGPLCAAGCYLEEASAKELKQMGVMDSKKLDDKKILKLADEIRKIAAVSFIVIRNKRYNELYFEYKNLNKLLTKAHIRIIKNLIEKTNANHAVLDKFADEKVVNSFLEEKGKKINLIQREKAEQDTAVAAASIIARAEYVKKMEELKEKYNFIFPKGAGDIVLQAGKDFIKKYGINELENVSKTHFKTYQIVRNA